MVRKYELFHREEDKDIETMFSRFRTQVSRLKVLEKSFTSAYHVKKILRSLLNKWRPKITTIQDAKDMNSLRLEELLSSLKYDEIKHIEDNPKKKQKTLTLRSKHKKALQPATK